MYISNHAEGAFPIPVAIKLWYSYERLQKVLETVIVRVFKRFIGLFHVQLEKRDQSHVYVVILFIQPCLGIPALSVSQIF